MNTQEAPLTATESAHLQRLSRTLLAGQGWGFWWLANSVIFLFVAALLGAIAAVDALSMNGPLAMLLAGVWLALNALYLAMRWRTRGLRGDMRMPVKQILQGECQSVHASGNALTYTVDGQAWRVYPALPRDMGFVAGLMRIEAAATSTGTPVAIERSAGSA